MSDSLEGVREPFSMHIRMRMALTEAFIRPLSCGTLNRIVGFKLSGCTRIVDPYLRSCIAPNHLHSGTTKKVIDVLYRPMGPKSCQQTVDVAFRETVKKVGIANQVATFSFASNMPNGMKNSSVYATSSILL